MRWPPHGIIARSTPCGPPTDPLLNPLGRPLDPLPVTLGSLRFPPLGCPRRRLVVGGTRVRRAIGCRSGSCDWLAGLRRSL
eukprot:1186540-Prorocentrum_minimum.AAC.3